MQGTWVVDIHKHNALGTEKPKGGLGDEEDIVGVGEFGHVDGHRAIVSIVQYLLVKGQLIRAEDAEKGLMLHAGGEPLGMHQRHAMPTPHPPKKETCGRR